MIDSRTAPYGALVLRITLGVMFIAYAGLKYHVFTLPSTAHSRLGEGRYALVNRRARRHMQPVAA